LFKVTPGIVGLTLTSAYLTQPHGHEGFREVQMNELRRNPITQKWIIYPLNSSKLSELMVALRRTGSFTRVCKHECSLCSADLSAREILRLSNGRVYPRRNYGTSVPEPWDVRVVAALEPLFGIDGQFVRRPERIYDVMSGYGASELILADSKHDVSWYELNDLRIRDVLVAVVERMKDLRLDTNMGHSHFFVNVGVEAGARFGHGYGELIVAPFVPEYIQRELEAARQHFLQRERCLFCDILDEELRRQAIGKPTRIVTLTRDYMTLVPFFCDHPFEMWIIPRSHASDFTSTPAPLLHSLAKMLVNALERIQNALGDLPLTITLMNQPNRAWGVERGYWTNIEHDWHWRMRIIPHLPPGCDTMRGFIFGTGSVVNAVLPERAVDILRSGASSSFL